MAHADFEEARRAVIGDFKGMAGTPGFQLAGFGGSVAAAGGAQDVPAGANAENDERSTRAGADGSFAGRGARQRDEADLGAGKGIAGFFVEDDAFDDCGVECRPGRERQQEEE